MSDFLVAPECVLVAPEYNLVAPAFNLVAPKYILVLASRWQQAAKPSGTETSILKWLMNPNDRLEKRPRAWDISVRAAQKKKWATNEKKWATNEKK